MVRENYPALPYWTCSEFAEFNGEKLKTVQNWCSSGAIRAKKVGKSWRIPNPTKNNTFILQGTDKNENTKTDKLN